MSEFLIWSEEHGAWWRPAARGYTTSMAEAGQYTHAQAAAIVRDGNFGWRFNEIAVPVPENLATFCKRGKPST